MRRLSLNRSETRFESHGFSAYRTTTRQWIEDAG
jgi:hypothetical protein